MFDFSTYLDRIVCVTSDGEQFTYRELEKQAILLGKHMTAGELTFLLCKNTLEALVGYVAALHVHSPALLLNAEIEETLLARLVEVYQPKQIWMPTSVLERTRIEAYDTCLRIGDYVLVQSKLSHVPLPDELAILLTTSGSTGSPKLVRLSRQNLMANANSIREYLNINQNERPITSLPMYYSYGLSVINSHLIVGATLLLTDDSYVQQSFWNFAKEQNATSFAGVPYTYEMLKKLKVMRFDLPMMRTFTQAGGKLSPDLIRYFVKTTQEQGKRFVVMYGQTEATARMSYVPDVYAIEKLGSVGIAIPDGSFAIEQDGHIITQPNETGELIYQGPNVCLGYANSREDLYKGDENRGVLHTGDVAYRDGDGFIYIVGRMKRFLKLFGNRISLDYAESLIKQQYGIDVACVGTDNKMIVYTTDVAHLEDIHKFISMTTHIQHSAFEVRHIDAILHSDSGKVQYNSLSNI